MKIKHVLAGLRIFEKYGEEDFEVTLPLESFNGPILPRKNLNQDDIDILEANGWECYEDTWFFDVVTEP